MLGRVWRRLLGRTGWELQPLQLRAQWSQELSSWPLCPILLSRHLELVGRTSPQRQQALDRLLNQFWHSIVLLECHVLFAWHSDATHKRPRSNEGIPFGCFVLLTSVEVYSSGNDKQARNKDTQKEKAELASPSGKRCKSMISCSR